MKYSYPEETSPFKKLTKEPKCARCRNHGIINILKGHKHSCEFRFCKCADCLDVCEKQKITAKRVATLRKEQKDRFIREGNMKSLNRHFYHPYYYHSAADRKTTCFAGEQYPDEGDSYMVSYDINWLIKMFPNIHREILTYFLCKSNGILPVAVQYALLFEKNR